MCDKQYLCDKSAAFVDQYISTGFFLVILNAGLSMIIVKSMSTNTLITRPPHAASSRIQGRRARSYVADSHYIKSLRNFGVLTLCATLS